jgi:hypothetical protein
MHHDPNAYLKTQALSNITPMRRAGRAAIAQA